MPRTLTSALPGTGGLLKQSPEDFLVEEVPAYLPSGSGEHTFLLIEKRALTTREALAALCRALSVREADSGVAGQKDKQAVSRQWLSLPRVDPQAALGLDLPVGAGRVTVLAAARHGNKLRTGHLRGNRFTVTLHHTQDGLRRARAVLDELIRLGVPNRYGEQRFGAGGRNAEDGKRLLLGELRVSDRFRRRFLISAYQSALFNRYLERRHEDGLLHRVLDGDILQKRDTGGLFAADPQGIAEASARVETGAVAVTGPIFGSRMMAPREGSEAAAREAAVLGEEGLDLARFAALGPLAEGTRRQLLVPLLPPSPPGPGPKLEEEEEAPPLLAAHPDQPDALILRFGLPPGSYATVVLEEIMKPAAALDLPL